MKTIRAKEKKKEKSVFVEGLQSLADEHDKLLPYGDGDSRQVVAAAIRNLDRLNLTVRKLSLDCHFHRLADGGLCNLHAAILQEPLPHHLCFNGLLLRSC